MTSVSSLSSSVLSNQSSSIGGLGQSLSALQSAVQSGNLSTAQTAFSSLLNYFPGLNSSANTSTSSNSTSTTSSIAGDLQTIQTAIQAGNVSAAQTAVSKLTTDLHSAKGHGGGRHHYQGGAALLNDALSGSSQSNSTSSSTSNSTSTDNSTSALLNAVGNTDSDGTLINYLA